MRANAADRESLTAVCRDAAVVYHCVGIPYPQWRSQLFPIAEAVVGAAGAADARLVVMDNLYMYGPPEGPMTETTPRAARGRKGKLRAQLEEYFLTTHRTNMVRLAIGRASDFFGIAANSAPNMLVIKPALAGKSVAGLGTLKAPHTLSYLPDVTRGLITLAQQEKALGEVWHLPAAEPLTGRQFIEIVLQELGRTTKIRVISRHDDALAGLFSPMIRERLEVFYQFERPFIMDSSKFGCAFGTQATPHREAIRETLRLGREDVVIGISFPRYTKVTVDVLAAAHERGCRIFALTDSLVSPLSRQAHVVLTARDSIPTHTDSFVAPLSVINALLAALSTSDKSRTSRNLRRLEDLWAKYHVYYKV